MTATKSRIINSSSINPQEYWEQARDSTLKLVLGWRIAGAVNDIDEVFARLIAKHKFT